MAILDATRPPATGTWTDAAHRVLTERYLAPDESPEDMCWRVAKKIATAERAYGATAEAEREVAEAFYDLMVRRVFLPNSPTLMNAGKDNGLQYSACFVLPVGDSMEEIFDAVKAAAIIHKSGGGTGFSFSRLRPKGSRVGSTGGMASGPVSFLKVFNGATEAVKQGGTRRGANMSVLRVDHPDILEFIDCKRDGGITNFNISVGITDAFMAALSARTYYTLMDPRGGEVLQLEAVDVWQRIVKAAWATGDPGLVFLDRVNQSPANPIPALMQIESTNPCGEQALPPWDACNLGSIVVSQFVNADTRLDLPGLARTVRLAVRFMDNVIDVNTFPLPQVEAAVKGSRRIGLGVMGWADLLFRVGLPYASEEAVKTGQELMAFIHETAVDTSRHLARERGPFPLWDQSIYRDEAPRRNATVTSIAPTGTISLIAGCSSGIEPVFALAFQHRVKQPDGERVLDVINQTFEDVLDARGLLTDGVRAWVAAHGSVQGMPELAPSTANVFKTAHEIDFVWHIRHQAAYQQATDNGVSKTINLPADATPTDVEAAYTLAWESGCRGITVFRDGCKGEQVLNAPVMKGLPEVVLPSAARPRPAVLSGVTHRVTTPVGVAYVTLNQTETGEPFEAFIQVGKAGSETMAVSEALGRLVSLVLRLPSSVPPAARLALVADQLAGIGGNGSIGFGVDRVRSLPDGIARALRAPDVVMALDPDLCGECGQSSLVWEEGCRKCAWCGFSEC